jgi:hypothetical protein
VQFTKFTKFTNSPTHHFTNFSEDPLRTPVG